MTEYRLLKEFRGLFDGKKYDHRNSTLGDFVAMHLYEDLMTLKNSDKYNVRVEDMTRVLNSANKRKGVEARRGDGTFGHLIPGDSPLKDEGYLVARGPIATVEIGVEVKILQKAMIKQIDRVQGNLKDQVRQFRIKSGSSSPLCVGIVGINFATYATSYEKDREYPTDGKAFKHPIQEAAEAQKRIENVVDDYDELLILRYRATNVPPYPFEWVDEKDTRQRYASALVRLSNEYQKRF